MVDIPHFTPGQTLSGLPASYLNRVGQAALQAERSGAFLPGENDGTAKLPAIPLDIVNGTGQALEPYNIVKLDVLTFVPEDDENKLPEVPLAVNAVAPKAGERFAILLNGVDSGSGSAGEAAAMGLMWVKVDVKSASDDTCDAVDDDFSKLESGSGSTPIVLKPTGTGVKWCVVMLGGGASGGGALKRGKLILSIDAADDIDTPGMTADAVQLVKWKDDGTGFENDGDPMKGVNDCYTGKRGSASEPVMVWGLVETVVDEKRFAIVDFDPIRGNPDYYKGTTPGPDDDPNLLILHKKGGKENAELASGPCDGEEPA